MSVPELSTLVDQRMLFTQKTRQITTGPESDWERLKKNGACYILVDTQDAFRRERHTM